MKEQALRSSSETAYKKWKRLLAIHEEVSSIHVPGKEIKFAWIRTLNMALRFLLRPYHCMHTDVGLNSWERIPCVAYA